LCERGKRRTVLYTLGTPQAVMHCRYGSFAEETAMPAHQTAAIRESHAQQQADHYWMLLIMTAMHFAAMYLLMYAMVNSFSNVYPNLNQFYMAGIMTAPMIMLELVLMGSMYENKRLNAAILAASAIIFVGFFLFIRNQTAIVDREFLRSMIPHHAGAILMCEQASIRDAEIRQLCTNIIAGQQAEIDQMKRKLAELNG
jgi:uncharacterized protein (DUF305 family)